MLRTILRKGGAASLLLLSLACDNKTPHDAAEKSQTLRPAEIPSVALGTSSCRTYSILVETKVTPIGATTPVVTRVKGALVVRGEVVATGYTVGALLSKPSFVITPESEETTAMMNAGLSEPVVFDTEGGLVTSTWATAEVAAPVLSTWRSVAAGLQFRTTNEDTFESEEFDSTGRYAAKYSWESKSKLVRTKERYLAILTTAVRLPALPVVEAAAWTGTFQDGRLMSVSSTETIVTKIQAGAELKGDHRIELNFTGEGNCPAGLSLPPTALKKGLVEFSSQKPVEQSSAEVRQKIDRERADGWTIARVADVLEKTHHLQSQSDEDDSAEQRELRSLRRRAFSSIGPLLRLHPEQEKDIRQLFQTRPEISKELISALGTSGSTAGEKLLVDLLKAPSTKVEDKHRVLKALGMSETQSSEAMTALIGTLNHEELSGQALMAVGAMGRRAREAGDQNTAKMARDAIERSAPKEPEGERAVSYLRAVSNLGDPATLPVVQPYLNSDSARIRSAAYAALRHMNTPGTSTIIVKALDNEKDSGGLLAALDAASKLTSPGPEVLGSVNRLLSRKDITDNVKAHAEALRDQLMGK